jgi:hypothetical protein
MEINKFQLIYFVIIIGLLYLLFNKYNKTEKLEEKNLGNPNLNETEDKVKNELQNESWKNQQFFFNPSNEYTAERINVEQLALSYLYF